MLGINMNDVYGVLNSCKPQLIFFGVVLVVAIVAMIACTASRKAQVHDKAHRTRGGR